MPPRALKIPLEDARRRLRDQIAKGRELLDQVIGDDDELEKYKLDRLRYTQYSIELLNSIFGEDQDVFWRYKISSPERYADFETQLAFYKELDTKQVNELLGLEQSLELMGKPSRGFPTVAADQRSKRWPNRVTLFWLFQNMPLKAWLALAGAVGTAFTFGMSVGQTALVRGLFTNSSETKPPLTQEQVKTRVDELTKGHNLRRQKLVEAIIEEQHQAARALTNSAEIQQAIRDLQKELEKEDANYQSELKLLNALATHTN